MDDLERILAADWGRWAIGLAACLVLAAAGSALLPTALQAARAVLQPLATSALAYAAAAVAASVVLALLPAWRRRFRT